MSVRFVCLALTLFALAACARIGNLPVRATPTSVPTLPPQETSVPVTLTELNPAQAMPGDRVHVIGKGGFAFTPPSGYNESARNFQMYFDGKPAGTLSCMLNHCEGDVSIPVDAAPGAHAISVEGDVRITITIQARTRLNIEPKAGARYLNVTYCNPDGIAQKMDVLYPKTLADQPMPVIVYVHGGGWTSGDKSSVELLDNPAMAMLGYVLVSLNYRLAPQYKFPAQIIDVKCALRHLRANAEQYKIDPNKIGVMGASAGGHLVALLGTTDQSAGFDVGEYVDQSSRAQAVVDLFGPADLPALFTSNALVIGRDVFGATSRDDPILVRASPVTYITRDDPPFLILQGDQDTTVPPQQSQSLYEKLKAGGVNATLVMVKNAGHGFAPVGGTKISPSLAELTKLVVEFFGTWLK
jgi:acetyl esterase/lipase